MCLLDICLAHCIKLIYIMLFSITISADVNAGCLYFTISCDLPQFNILWILLLVWFYKSPIILLVVWVYKNLFICGPITVFINTLRTVNRIHMLNAVLFKFWNAYQNDWNIFNNITISKYVYLCPHPFLTTIKNVACTYVLFCIFFLTIS